MFAAIVGMLCMDTSSAETLYVVDHLQVRVFPEATLEGETVGLIRTGDTVELITREAEAAQVRLADGTEGWVEGKYLSEEAPAAVRLEGVIAENDRLKAAARSASGNATDLKALQASNAELKAGLDQARAEVSRLREAARAVPAALERPARRRAGELVSAMMEPTTPMRMAMAREAWRVKLLDRKVQTQRGGVGGDVRIGSVNGLVAAWMRRSLRPEQVDGGNSHAGRVRGGEVLTDNWREGK